jgi:hypothetical protein
MAFTLLGYIVFGFSIPGLLIGGFIGVFIGWFIGKQLKKKSLEGHKTLIEYDVLRITLQCCKKWAVKNSLKY